ncbi:putative ribose-phosphate pyrophosphokinase [Cercophora samala]|uniref:ribose-phosphate diphosphokinase n=1 Tax=Cercophora samala TaxID=330535 RepID=A0AA40DEN0_9PEZI|nr:putative ribose-phosphate pyrophosphokinase [Cercophora samala]
MTRKTTTTTMVRNIAILSGNSHPSLALSICNYLSISPSERILCKFSSGESRCEIQDSVRGKDVYIIQSFGVGHDPSYKVNDYLMELCIMIAACKGGSARRVTAVLPLFPYSRQPDLAFSKAGAPLRGEGEKVVVDGDGGKGGGGGGKGGYTFESVPVTPHPNIARTTGLGKGVDMTDVVGRVRESDNAAGVGYRGGTPSGIQTPPLQLITYGTGNNNTFSSPSQPPPLFSQPSSSQQGQFTTHDYENPSLMLSLHPPRPGYKQWMAQSGSLVADLLTCSGADRILTCDLHESTYQGFFDIPVDNLHARPFLCRYISRHILPPPLTKNAVIISPDAGGAKRATAIADALNLPFALIHKERRPPKFSAAGGKNMATMMLVGEVRGKTCLLVDDLVDTGNTLTRAAKLLKREGADKVVAVVTHGVFSGDALERIESSGLDKVVVTNTVDQGEHLRRSRKVEVLDVSGVFGEAVRRVHFGESLAGLFEGEGML